MNFAVSSAFVGRAGDVAALETAFADEQTRTVLIGGEAGIGKSRLAGEFTSRLDKNVLVLVGRCPEFGADGVPFAPFIAVMRSLQRQRSADELATLLPPNPALARWMPQLAARTGLHARLAEVLRARPDLLPAGHHSAELAHHAAAAGDRPQALAASWQAAAIAGTADAHPQQLRQLERVLELWDQVPQAPRLLDTTKPAVLEQIVDACARSGAVERGIQAADAALALIDPGIDPQRGAHLHHRRAYLLSQTGAGPGEDLQRALQLLPADPPTLERGEVLADLAATHVFSGDTSGATAHASAAAGVAEQLGAATLAARAHAYLGLAAANRPGTAAAIAAEDPQTLLNVVTWESSVLLAAGSYQAAITSIQQGLRIAHESFRFTESAPILLVKWAQALTALGRWPQALGLIAEAELEQLPPLSRAALLLCHAKIALAQGNSATAHSSAAAAEKLLGGGQWARPYRLQLRAVQCLLALEHGDRAGAAQILAETVSANDSAALAAHPHEAWPLAVLAAGIPDAPADSVALAESLPSTSAVDAAHRAVFTARPTATAPRWDDAARMWHALGQPYDEAQSLVAAAEAHAAEGNRAAANTALHTAAEIAAELGAAPLADAAGQLARRARLSTGRISAGTPDPHGGNRSGRFGLIPREHCGCARLPYPHQTQGGQPHRSDSLRPPAQPAHSPSGLKNHTVGNSAESPGIGLS